MAYRKSRPCDASQAPSKFHHLARPALRGVLLGLAVVFSLLWTTAHAHGARASAGLLNVTLVDAIDGTSIAGVRVDAYARYSNGRVRWRGRRTTDEAGNAAFEIRGFREGGGPSVFLRARPFGKRVYSSNITQPGNVEFPVGRLRLRLVSGADGTPLAEHRVVLREQLDNGKSRWVTHGVSDSEGEVRMDPRGLGEGRTFYAAASSPVNGRRKQSGPISEPGIHEFVVGSKPLVVTLVDAMTGAPLPGMRISARERYNDGSRRWAGRETTDASGVALFDLDGLGEGRLYQLKARRLDRRRVYSPLLSETGEFEFRVNKVPVTLVDADANAPMPGHRIVAMEQMINGTLRWRGAMWTDERGIARFDPLGIEDGRTYVFRVKNPFGDKLKFYTDPVSEAGPVAFNISRDGDPNLDKEVPKLEVTTPTEGADVDIDALIVSGTATDNKAVDQMDVLISTSANPNETMVPVLYNDADKTFSAKIDPALLAAGPVTLTVRAWDKAQNEALVVRNIVVIDDKEPPKLEVTSPTEGANVPIAGFQVMGTASDNKSVDLVEVLLVNASATAGVAPNRVVAVYNEADNTFSADIETALLAAGSLSLTVRAVDKAGNESLDARSVQVVADSAPPNVTITSPMSGDSVPGTGFVVSGTATDDAALASLVGTVDDPVLGRTVDSAPVLVVADTGAFSFAVAGSDVTPNAGALAMITLVATDESGKQSTAIIQLEVVEVDTTTRHLINRITFGATPELLGEVATIGAAAYRTEQLDPTSIDDSAFETMMASIPTPSTVRDLQVYQLLHAIYSRRQLREVMTWFWENHFSTNVNSDNSGLDNTVAYELAENKGFRADALGRFRDLLETSAKSPAMLIYLDSISNVASDPNENYPRELLELHTMGVDGGYTQEDVEEVARAFTGWQIQGGAFFFNAADHDIGEKVVLGQTVSAGGGVDDGERVLDILSTSMSTAVYVCTKLTQLLVSDDPPFSLVGRCANTFIMTSTLDNQIGIVLLAILSSPEFNDPAYFRAKVKNPLELSAGLVRNFAAVTDAEDLPSDMRNMGMRLFEYPVPTGFPEVGEEWISSVSLLERMKFVDQVAFNEIGAGRTYLEPRAYALANGATSAEAITALFFDLAHAGEFTALEWDTAIGVLTEGGTVTFDIDAPDADLKLRSMLGIILSYPGYQYN
jgi:hypothetical protein